MPVGNAFFILLIVSMVYAIMGTTFFAERSPEYFGGNIIESYFSINLKISYIPD